MGIPPGGRARIGILGRSYGFVTSTPTGTAGLSSRAQVTAAAYKIKVAAVALSSNGTITAVSTVVSPAFASISGNSTLTATAIVFTPVVKFADSISSGRGQVTATPPARTRLAFAGLEGRAVITASAVKIKNASVSVSGNSVITAVGFALSVASSGLSSSAQVTATAYNKKQSGSTLSGNATVSATGNKNGSLSALSNLSGNATIVATAVVVSPASASISGNAIVIAAVTRGKVASSSISGNAIVVASAFKVSTKAATATISGNATITATGSKASGKAATASISGRGQITATGSRQVFASISARAAVIATASNSNARSNISGFANINARASSATARTSISCNATIAATVIRSRTYSVTTLLECRAVLLAIATPPPRACECPPWIVDDNTTCNWSAPVICVDQVDAELPYTLPAFRIQNLSKATYRGYILRGTNCTPYAYTGGPSGTYIKTNSLTYSWINASVTTNQWNVITALYSNYTRQLSIDRDLPYTLPIFRLHAPSSQLVVACGYTRQQLPAAAYTVELPTQNVYNVFASAAGTYVRKGCE